MGCCVNCWYDQSYYHSNCYHPSCFKDFKLKDFYFGEIIEGDNRIATAIQKNNNCNCSYYENSLLKVGKWALSVIAIIIAIVIIMIIL